MYRKLHLQLSFFCCLVISIILISMTCFILKLVRDNQDLRSFQDFEKIIDSTFQTLSGQDSISHTWLNKVSAEYGLQIAIWDNEKPIIYNSNSENQNLDDAFALAQETALNSYALSPASVKNSRYVKHIEFKLDIPGRGECLTSVGYIPKELGTLTVTALCKTDWRPSGLKDLFLPIVLLTLAAIFFLSLCSFFLIRHLIKPLVKSHEQQISFFTAASHELRSPLAVIITSLPFLKNPSDEKRRTFYPIIEKECLRMQSLVNDMFTLASLNNKETAVHKENVFLDNLLIESYEKFELIAARRQIHIQFHLPDELIPQVYCDPERITQLLSILLDNAVSYTPKSGTIQISLALQAGKALISVSDSGPGIPDPDRENIFHRFYRCDSARTDKSHFGLGLSIAKEIIELHNGTISVTDSPLGGAQFIIKLPILDKTFP